MNVKKLGVYSILLVLVVTFVSSFVLAQESWLTDSKFYDVISSYLIPGGMEGLSGLVIGIVTIVILFAIFLDVLTLIAPFSKGVIWIMAIGFGLIAVLFKLNVTVAGWIFAIGATIFAWAGALAGVLTIVLGIIILAAIFFGGQWIMKWAANVRLRRQGFEKVGKARTKGQTIKALSEMSKEATAE